MSEDEPIRNPSRSAETVLSVLPGDLSAKLFSSAHELRLNANQTLFTAGDPGDGCYRIESGLLKVTVMSPTGDERIFAILGPGSLVGELALLDAQPRSASVMSLRDSLLTFITRSTFLAVLEIQPRVYRDIMLLLARRLRGSNSAVAAMSFLSREGRVAHSLLGLAAAFGKDVGSGRNLIHQKMTQTDLAAMSGIARENVSRILNDWMRRNIVSRNAGYYCIEDRAALEKECAM
jgi:CRP/FNR family transcriptional regulator, cyclic AMP receptor protein